jgi:hypothetical protein
MRKFLIIECKELQDQYECGYRKTPIKVVNNYLEYFSLFSSDDCDYEVWEIKNDGFLFRLLDPIAVKEIRSYVVPTVKDN